MLVGSLLGLTGLGAGVQLSSMPGDAIRTQVEQLQAQASAVQAPPKNKVLKVPPEVRRARDYWKEIRNDAKSFGVAAPSKRRLESKQRYRRLIRKRRTLRLGKRLRKGPLEMRATLESVRFVRQGASLKSKHSVLTLRNRGSNPVAYRIELRAKRRGRCDVRGTRRHNALALLPGEKAEITVCAGKSAIELSRLEILELSALGYHYLSRVPPQAFGVGPTRASAHGIPHSKGLCTQIAAPKLGRELRKGQVKWADLADFYSRHSCENYRFPTGYRRSRKGAANLPAPGATHH